MTAMQNEAARTLLLAAFADACGQVIGTGTKVTYKAWQKALSGDDGRIDQSGLLVAGLRLRGTLHGEISLGIPEQQASALLLADQREGDHDLDSQWGTFVGRIGVCLPKRATDAERFPFSVETDVKGAARTGVAVLGTIDLKTDTVTASIQVRGDEELMSSLTVGEWSTRPLAGKAVESSSPRLDRVVDVPLTVMLRFGERQMRLRDVLDLNTGSLVDLDRQVEEPVDLLLGERVLARGEVVIVDGNYGLRVTEVLDSGAQPWDNMRAK